MFLRKRNDITRTYLSSIIQKIITDLENSDDYKLGDGFFNHLYGKDKRRKEIFQFLAEQRELLTKLQQEDFKVDLFSEYYKLLSQLNYLKSQLSESLQGILNDFLVDELSVCDEAEWPNSTDKIKDIEYSLLVLSDAVLYESKEHIQFCRTWHVTESFDNFPIWKRFVKQVLDEESELRKDYYGKIVSDICGEFDIHRDGYADIDNGEHSQLMYGTDMMDHQHKLKKKCTPLSDFKNELSIWTPDNIAKLFVMFMRNYINDFSVAGIDSIRNQISMHVISPLLREFVSEARYKLGRVRFSDYEIAKAQNQFCHGVDKLLCELAQKNQGAMSRNSHFNERPLENNTVIIEPPLTFKTPSTIDDNNKTIIPKKTSPNWELLGCIVGGLALGAVVTTVMLLTMGSAAPIVFGGLMLTMLHITAATNMAAWLGGSMLMLLPVIGACLGGAADLMVRGMSCFRACCGKDRHKDKLHSPDCQGLDSRYIHKKLSGDQKIPDNVNISTPGNGEGKKDKSREPFNRSPSLSRPQLFQAPNSVQPTSTGLSQHTRLVI